MQRLILLSMALGLVACAGAFPAPVIPVGLTPASAADIQPLVVSTRPTGHTTLRFHWIYNRDAASGRGSVLIAPPDSIKLHYSGPAGFGAGTAAVVGDSALWTEPPQEVDKFVASYALLWAMVGVVRPPRAGWVVQTHRDANATMLRYTHGSDTLDYVWVRSGIVRLEAYVREGGKPIGRVVTVFDADNHPVKSRLDVSVNPARLDITFDKISKPLQFGREDWLAPHEQ